MTVWTAWTTGFGIGLASIGGLWLTVRCAAGSSRGLTTLAASHLVRMSLTAAGFYAVLLESPGLVVPALAGFWIARRVLIGKWGGIADVGS
jgi:F1F0 ATPase subunit 2